MCDLKGGVYVEGVCVYGEGGVGDVFVCLQGVYVCVFVRACGQENCFSRQKSASGPPTAVVTNTP